MKAVKDVLYSFDSYTVEVAERRLWNNKELVQLTPKAFDTLIVLLTHKGKIVEKDVLLNEVWQDTFVEESTLAQNISTLRKALGTAAGGKQFIETVPRHGYRFVGEVKEIIGDEEIIVIEHHKRTQISAEQESVSQEIVVQPVTKINKEFSVKAFTDWLRQNALKTAAFVLFFCVAFSIILLGVRYYFQPSRLSATAFKNIELSKLTSNGNTSLVKASPDGNFLAMVEKQGENFSLQLRQIDNSKTIEIIPPQKLEFIGITFSPDSKNIYYAAYDKKNRTPAGLLGKLYKVSTLGGQVQEIVEDIDSPITISPDGKQFAFVRNYLAEKQSAIIISDFETKQEKRLHNRRIREFFTSSGLAWSPDGKTIAAIAHKDGTRMGVSYIDANSGEEKSFSSENWLWIGSPNWLSDGSGLIVSAFSGRSGDQTDEIWQLPYPEGEAQKITGGISGINGISLTKDSKNLVAVKSALLSSFWTTQIDDPKQSVKITQNLRDYNFAEPGINWTPDGKILYGATLNGNMDVWMMNTDGSQNRQITTEEAADSMPVVSADGQNIFFISNRSGKRNLWRMKIDGSEQKQLTDETSINSPSISADGKTIFYTALDKMKLTPYLYRISSEGGESVQLNSTATLFPQISPDGKFIACYYPKDQPNGNTAVALGLTILSSETAEVVKRFDVALYENLSPISWADNQSFFFTTNEGGGSRLWRQSIEKDSPDVFLDSPDESIFRFAWSKEKQQMVYEKGTAISDVILIKSTGRN